VRLGRFCSARWLALGAVLISRLINAAPFVADSPDMRYAVQSIVFVAWPALALVRLAWGPDSTPGWAATVEHRATVMAGHGDRFR